MNEKLPEWIYAGPNLSFESLSKGYQQYLCKRLNYDTNRRVTLKTKNLENILVEYISEQWLHTEKYFWEAKGFAWSIDKGFPNDVKYMVFKLWVEKKMWEFCVENKWFECDPYNETEFRDIVGWESWT